MNKVFDFEKAAIGSIVVSPLQTNVYVIGCKETKEAAIIDAGGNAPGLLQLAERLGFKITKILQTHAHIDHVAALSQIKEATAMPIYLHPADQPLYDAAVEQGKRFGFTLQPLPPVDETLEDGQVIEIGNLKTQVWFLPGHSPGSVAFYFEELKVALSGDVLFAGSIGRVDLPLSDPGSMKLSLERLKKDMPDDTLILSGHGPETTMEMERKRNPFLNQDY